VRWGEGQRVQKAKVQGAPLIGRDTEVFSDDQMRKPCVAGPYLLSWNSRRNIFGGFYGEKKKNQRISYNM